MAPLLNSYLKHLRNNRVPFKCPHCVKQLVPDEFEVHCTAEHHLRGRCIWCLGLDVDFNHRIKCFQNFIKPHVPPNPEPKAPEDLPDLPIWPIKLGFPAPTYEFPELNEAVASLQLFLNSYKSTQWNHVMVRAPALKSLYIALDDGKHGTLSFYRYCDDGLVHRHLILASNAKNFWKAIKCPKKNLNIRKQTIDSPMQLVNLIGQLSHSRTRCPFEANEVDAFPMIYRIALATQWDGGLLELIEQEYGAMDPEKLVHAARSFRGLWGIRVRDLPGIPLKAALPVVSMRPTTRATETFVHLVHGRKMYFDEEGGEEAGVFEWIGDEVWFPTPYQQKCINLAKPLSERIADLEQTLERAKKDAEQREVLARENEGLKRKLDEVADDLKNLQRKHIDLLERENDILRVEVLKKVRV